MCYFFEDETIDGPIVPRHSTQEPMQASTNVARMSFYKQCTDVSHFEEEIIDGPILHKLFQGIVVKHPCSQSSMLEFEYCVL